MSAFDGNGNGKRPDYDAIVVGGGHNGLTAAAYLARAGLRVCVLEAREILGGACVTEELWPGQRVSRASYVVSMLQPKVVADLELTKNIRLEPHGTTGENRLPGMVEEVVYLGFHQEVRVRLATGTLVKADVSDDDEQVEHEQGDPVSVHMPPRHLRVLAADDGVPAAPAATPEEVPAG